MENPLYDDPKTMMLPRDALATITEFVVAQEEPEEGATLTLQKLKKVEFSSSHSLQRLSVLLWYQAWYGLTGSV